MQRSRGKCGDRTPSQRDRIIIRCVAEGMRNKEIALEIGTTENVVKNYLKVIFDNLGVWNRVELALWYEAHKESLI